MLDISVLIYTYDRKDYIRKAVDTVLKQKLNKALFEIIVIKGFSDNAIDDWLQKNGVRTILLDEKSLGKKIARGIRESHGEIITFLDDDDEYESIKLKKISEIFNRDPEVDFVHNSLLKIDESGNIIDQNPTEDPPKNLIFLPRNKNSFTLSRILRYRGDWYLSCMSARKSVLLKDLDSLDNIDQSVDKFIFFTSINHGRKIMMISDKLTRYRVHLSTTTYMDTEENFINRRKVFFKNTVRTFEKIASMSAKYPGNEPAICQMIQHKINLYFISEERDSKVPMPEFIDFLRCLRIECNRYQLIWIGAFLLRRISLKLSITLYYKFFKMSFKEVVAN